MRILIVDDDATFRTLLENTLKEEKYDIITADCGRTAQSIVALQEVDLVLSDIRMSPGNGIELLHYVRRERPAVPVVLMTGFAELAETQEAHNMGASGFMPKPFKREELVELLQRLLPKDGETVDAAPAQQDNDFCKLPINEFVSGREIRFDIYVRLGEHKYVKVAHHGENIDVERIRSYRSRGISFLYLKKDDFRAYVGFNVKLLQVARDHSAVSQEKRLRLLKHAGEVIMERLYSDNIDKEAIQVSASVVESSLSVLSDSSSLLEVLSLLQESSNVIYARSILASVVAVMVAREVQWGSMSNLFKISLGAILHDVGLREIDSKILAKPRREMTPEDIKLYESHPMRGVEILGRVRGLPSEVLQIVLQHHENCVGTGYPYGLAKKASHPFARLVNVASVFSNLIIETNRADAMSVPEAVQHMLAVYSHELDSTFLNALARVFTSGKKA